MDLNFVCLCGFRNTYCKMNWKAKFFEVILIGRCCTCCRVFRIYRVQFSYDRCYWEGYKSFSWIGVVSTLMLLLVVRSFYAARIDWMIWKMAEPHTTKMNSANSQGPTGYCPSFVFCNAKKKDYIKFHSKNNKNKEIPQCLQVLIGILLLNLINLLMT